MPQVSRLVRLSFNSEFRLWHSTSLEIGEQNIFMNVSGGKIEITAPVTDAVQTETLTLGESAATVRVWLVDDNDQFRTLVADLLGRREGIECARQFSSPDALLSALASKSGPDVILLDIEMGAQNGLDAVRPIKSLTRSTRVLMFTTCYDPEYRQRALDDGASDYVLKSESLDKLVERIRQPDVPGAARRLRVKRVPKPVAEPVPINFAGAKAGRASRPLTRTLQILRSLWN